MDESNKNVKNKIGVTCTPDYRQFLTKRSYFEIPRDSNKGVATAQDVS